MKIPMPEFTVLMAVRNGEPFIRAAVESVLHQSHDDFAFLVVDDASTDNTREIVRGYGDPRIRLLALDENVGQTAALNRGLKEVKTDWIARMDADDYSAPDRLATLLEAVEADPPLVCVGSFAWTFQEDPSKADAMLERPVDDGAIRSALLWSSPIIHGSMAARTKAMTEAGAYNDRYRYSADLDLYDRLLMRGRAANVPEPLYGVRWHAGQDSYSAKAVRESIAIFEGRLASTRYSPRERRIVRSAKHLHEGLCASLESRRAALAVHTLRALWYSPTLTLEHVSRRLARLAGDGFR
jgi:glycosyltransferase involved in cell wall biosynthesis